MYHGFGSYVGKYGHIAKMFVDAGYEVCGVDSLGFGRSEGIRGYLKSQEDYQRDCYTFAKLAKQFYKETYPNHKVPVIGWGYSQGGKAVLGAEALLHKDGDGFDGMILNTPNLLIQVEHLEGEPMKLIKEAAEEDHVKPIAWPFKPLKDASFLAGYVQDELQFVGPHLGRTFYENILIPQHIQDNYQNIKVPIMMVIAGEDTVLDNGVMKKLIDEQVSTPEHLKEMRVYEGQDHYLLADGWKYEEVINDEINFLNRVFAQQ